MVQMQKKIRTRILVKIKSESLDLQSWLQPSQEDGGALGRGWEGKELVVFTLVAHFKDRLIFQVCKKWTP